MNPSVKQLPAIASTGIAWKDARDEPLLRWLYGRAELRGASFLDVGALDGLVSRQIAGLLGSREYRSIDVRPQGPSVEGYDGTRLHAPDGSFDLVIFNWVLHHAADHTIQLLRDAARIARSYVVVAEDLKETAEDCLNAAKHDIRGTFRGDLEWRALFSLLGLHVVEQLEVPRRLAQDDYNVTRRVYVLAPLSSAAGADRG